MMKRLYIDLETCYKCKECKASCSYFYHPENKGIITLLEKATHILVCRKCEEAPCVKACPNEALEKQSDGSLKRYSMRCTGCKTCTLACPFGATYPEVVPYLTSQCEHCLEGGKFYPVDRILSAGRDGELPECVKSCPEKAVQYIEVEEDKEKDIYFIGNHLAVHAIPWKKETLV